MKKNKFGYIASIVSFIMSIVCAVSTFFLPDVILPMTTLLLSVVMCCYGFLFAIEQKKINSNDYTTTTNKNKHTIDTTKEKTIDYEQSTNLSPNQHKEKNSIDYEYTDDHTI